MSNMNSHQIRQELRKVPPPSKNWEARMIREVVKHSQQQQGQARAYLAALVNLLYRRPVLVPALTVLCLLGVGLWHPITYYSGADAQYKAAVSYTEQITGLDEDSEDQNLETLNSWIPDN